VVAGEHINRGVSHDASTSAHSNATKEQSAMRIYTIYMATNMVNGKRYIGFDSAWPRRMRTHISTAYNDSIKAQKYRFHAAIRKYGKNNFEWTVLYQSHDGEHTKNSMEQHFITEYRTYSGFSDCNGYNLSIGGDGNLGHKQSDSAKLKMSINKTGRLTTQSRMITTPFGVFDSITKAATETGIDRNTVKHRAESPLCADWYFTDSPKIVRLKLPHPGSVYKTSRPITTPNGIFDSVSLASISIGIPKSSVWYNLRSPHKTDWSFI
jgi:predicted GIY-YIG superfamily endonuclease